MGDICSIWCMAVICNRSLDKIKCTSILGLGGIVIAKEKFSIINIFPIYGPVSKELEVSSAVGEHESPLLVHKKCATLLLAK